MNRRRGKGKDMTQNFKLSDRVELIEDDDVPLDFPETCGKTGRITALSEDNDGDIVYLVTLDLEVHAAGLSSAPIVQVTVLKQNLKADIADSEILPSRNLVWLISEKLCEYYEFGNQRGQFRLTECGAPVNTGTDQHGTSVKIFYAGSGGKYEVQIIANKKE